MSWWNLLNVVDAVASSQELDDFIDRNNLRNDGSWQHKRAVADLERDKQVWRIRQLLNATLDEKRHGLSKAPAAQMELRTLCLAVHEEMLRRFQLDVDKVNAHLQAAESSVAARRHWLREQLTDQHRQSLDRISRLAA